MHPYQGSSLPLPSPATLRGVPLEPGERIVYFHHTRNIGTRIAMFFMGLGLAVILIGFLFLWIALTDQSDTHAVTTKRFIRVQGKKPAQVMGLRDVVRHETVRARRWMSEVRLFDANGRLMEVRVMHDEAFRDLVLRLVKEPDAVATLPSVSYLA